MCIRDSAYAEPMPPRFLQLADVAEILNISSAQAYACLLYTSRCV